MNISMRWYLVPLGTCCPPPRVNHKTTINYHILLDDLMQTTDHSNHSNSFLSSSSVTSKSAGQSRAPLKKGSELIIRDLYNHGKSPKKRNTKPPTMYKLFKPAIGVALAMMAYYFMKGITSEITWVDGCPCVAWSFLWWMCIGEGLCSELPTCNESCLL
jgi:hypothetical protein